MILLLVLKCFLFAIVCVYSCFNHLQNGTVAQAEKKPPHLVTNLQMINLTWCLHPRLKALNKNMFLFPKKSKAFEDLFVDTFGSVDLQRPSPC